MNCPRFLVATGLLAAVASAQSFSLVIPAGMATAEGSTSNAFPWGRGGTGLRLQTIYDSTHFTTQGATYPILINRLRWRPNTNVASAASSYPAGATVQLSTCPVDQAAVTTTFASNQGADLTTCFNGPVSWPAATATAGPCPFLIDIPFTTNFLYDPNLGDLNIETDLPIQSFTGTGLQLDVHGTAALASRVYLSTGYTNGGPNATGLAVNTNHGVVVEVSYVPAAGLYAGFTATPTSGASPLLVQFTDRTFTSDPAGVLSWAWDFDGDSVIDSTQQNPSWTYTNCGNYTVSLTVTDASHSPNTLTRTNYITTDVVVPGFTTSIIAPNTVQFTDTSVPTPTSWAWDFDGDNVVDSTAQNPAWVYPTGCGNRYLVSLTVGRACAGPFTTSQNVSPTGMIETRRDGNTSTSTGSGGYFDVSVTNPGGIVVCAMETRTTAAASAPVTVNVFVTPNTYVGNQTVIGNWRLLASAATVGAPGANDLEYVQFATPFFLAPGNYGMHVQISGASAQYNTLTATATYSNSDLTMSLGAVGVLGSTPIANRCWNGAIYYSTPLVTGDAAFGWFDSGCAGSLGITNQVATSRPVLGQSLNVNLNNLPQSAAIMLLGLSRTSSPFGPLPLDLTAFGAPGCSARVSPDVNLFAFGAANAATWTLPIPNNPSLGGVRLYSQAFVPDAVNTLGGVMSDAAAMRLGN